MRKSRLHFTLFAATALALAGTFAGITLGRAATQQQQRTLPVFIDGQAQTVPGFAEASTWIRERLWVETSFDTDGDGKRDRMHVDVVRPRQTETEGLKVPVIYESSPYYAGTANDMSFLWPVEHEVGAPPPKRVSQPEAQFSPNRTQVANSQVSTWVPRGFAVVHSDSPGTGLSQGCPTVGGPNESLAPKAVIDWLNGRAAGYTTVDGNVPVAATWSTGKVGMTGTSYNGTLPLAAATTGVEGLAAIIPIAPNTSYYHYYRSNGLVRSPGGYLGEDVDFLFDYIQSGNPERRAYCNANVRDGEMAKGRDRVTGDYNDFWAGRDYLNSVQNVKAAVLMAHAFNDWNVVPEHSVRIYEALKGRVPLMAYFHQGGHGGAPPMEMMNRWFSKYLYGIDNGVENGPRAYIVREPPPAREGGAGDSAAAAAAAAAAAGRGRGRGGAAGPLTAYADYPNPDARGVTLSPGAGGAAMGSLGVGNAGTGRETLVDDVTHRGGVLAQAERSPNRLIYATPELTQPVHISGAPRITVRLASSKPAANLSVWLVMLPWVGGPGGTANLITRGWADPQNSRSIRSSEPLVPGRFYDVTFNLQPDDQIVPAGKRIGLMIFSSDREFTVWPPPGTELTVDLAGTSLVLPVVGGANAFAAATGR